MSQRSAVLQTFNVLTQPSIKLRIQSLLGSVFFFFSLSRRSANPGEEKQCLTHMILAINFSISIVENGFPEIKSQFPSS